MRLNFTVEQEAQLSEIARFAGTEPERLLLSVASHLLAEDAQFRAGVRRGIEAANKGDFIDDAVVWKNIEAIVEP